MARPHIGVPTQIVQHSRCANCNGPLTLSGQWWLHDAYRTVRCSGRPGGVGPALLRELRRIGGTA